VRNSGKKWYCKHLNTKKFWAKNVEICCIFQFFSDFGLCFEIYKFDQIVISFIEKLIKKLFERVYTCSILPNLAELSESELVMEIAFFKWVEKS
jgi:hypothetical protein